MWDLKKANLIEIDRVVITRGWLKIGENGEILGN